jgi:hypothetical protein
MSTPNDAVTTTYAIAQATDVGQLSDGTRIRQRAPRQRACSLKDAKGKLCAGHLKRWYFYGAELEQRYGKNAEIYRCQNCKAIYLPNPDETPRSATLAYYTRQPAGAAARRETVEMYVRTRTVGVAGRGAGAGGGAAERAGRGAEDARDPYDAIANRW